MSLGDLGRINTNLLAKQSLASLNRINRTVAQSQLRLATGLRINRAEDDAAGFSIAAKLRSRVAGLEQALQNTGDAKSVLDIAESSLNSLIDIVTTLKTKATQAANGSLGSEERGFIQLEVETLRGEIDSIVAQTQFQNQALLDGNFNANFQVGEGTASAISVEISQGGAGFTAAELNLDGIDVSTQAGASSALTEIDAAISTLASAVNSLGVSQTRLSIREEFLSRSIITNSAIRSRIQDVDFARETSNLIRGQIIQQTAIASLVQANAAPASILQILSIDTPFGFATRF